MEIYVNVGRCDVKKIFDFHIFSFLSYLYHIHYFTHIAASNTASDNVTTYVTHRILNTDSLYSCAPFVVKIGQKFSLNDGFNMI